MCEHKFKTYLRSRQWNDAQSLFVDHALEDASLPDPKSWDELKAYLEDSQAAENVIREAEYIWKLYEGDTRGSG